VRFDLPKRRRYASPMAKNVIEVSLSALTRQRLMALARAEFFGDSAPAVARRFIEDGLRKAAKDGWLGDVRMPLSASNASSDATSDE